MDVASFPVTDLLPHGPEMTIIDRLAVYAVNRSIAVVEVTLDSPFLENTGVPAWVGIEYMAQTIAAHAGFEAKLCGERPVIGFLLGTRAYECSLAEFPLGSCLKIIVEPLFAESGFGSFSCSIETDRIIATAVVNTYQPDEDESLKLAREWF